MRGIGDECEQSDKSGYTGTDVLVACRYIGMVNGVMLFTCEIINSTSEMITTYTIVQLSWLCKRISYIFYEPDI